MKIILTFSSQNMHINRILTWLHTALSLAPYDCDIEIGDEEEVHEHRLH